MNGTSNGMGQHNNNSSSTSNSQVCHDEYQGCEDSLNDDFRTTDNNSNNDSHNGNLDYQSESLIDYQDFIEDESDFRSMLDQPSGRKRVAESIDYWFDFNLMFWIYICIICFVSYR